MDNLSKPRRKTFTSTAVKNRYNAAHYKQFSAKIKPDLMEQIESYIDHEGISKPEFLLRAIDILMQNK